MLWVVLLQKSVIVDGEDGASNDWRAYSRNGGVSYGR